MRVAETEDDLENALQAAQQEAAAAFGNAGIYLEKYVGNPRHVEVQVIADQHGNVVHPMGTGLLHSTSPSKTHRRVPGNQSAH